MQDWLDDSDLADGVAITTVRGVGVEQVLAAFGAHGQPLLPTDPIIEAAAWSEDGPRPWAAFAVVPGGVIVVEPNGFAGTLTPVLSAATAAGGLGVVVYWNVNMLSDIEVAQDGVVVGGINDMEPHGTDRFRELVSALGEPGDDLDPDDAIAWGLRAQAELVGVELTEELWSRLQSTPCAHLLLPPLPEQHPGSLSWHSEVHKLAPAVIAADEPRVRELVWQAAGAAAAAAGADARPEVASSLASWSLDAQAQLVARRALLDSGPELVLWRMLHAATNPDAPTALLSVLGDASFLMAPQSFDALLARVRSALA